MNRHTQADLKGCAPMVVWISYMGHFLQVSFGQHLALPGSESIFGVSQDPPICECTYISRDGFQWRSLCIDWHHLLWGGASSLLTFREPFHSRVIWEISLTSGMTYMWSFIFYLGRAQLLFPPAIVFFLEYLSRENKLQLGSMGPICLLPQFHVLIYLVFGMRETWVLKLCFFFFINVKRSSYMFYV